MSLKIEDVMQELLQVPIYILYCILSSRKIHTLTIQPLPKIRFANNNFEWNLTPGAGVRPPARDRTPATPSGATTVYPETDPVNRNMAVGTVIFTGGHYMAEVGP
jgi:hypothetical protein